MVIEKPFTKLPEIGSREYNDKLSASIAKAKSTNKAIISKRRSIKVIEKR